MENKRMQAGRLLNENYDIQVYELEMGIGSISGRMVGMFDHVTAAFSSTHVAVRVSRGQSDDLPQETQVVLSREVFQVLLGSYRAFERAEKKRLAARAGEPDDYDPFLDSDDLP